MNKNKNSKTNDLVKLNMMFGPIKKWSKSQATISFESDDYIMSNFLILSKELKTTDYSRLYKRIYKKE